MSLRKLPAYLTVAVIVTIYADIHTLRFEHYFLLSFSISLAVISRRTRDLLIAVLPLIAFGWIYDLMRLFEARAAEVAIVEAIYDAERLLFGWMTPETGDLGPVDFFRDHHHIVVDALGGLTYAMHLPTAIIFGLYLWWRCEQTVERSDRKRLHIFMWGFLTMAVIALAVQALLPVAPPWYVEQYGFEPPGTPIEGDPAGLARVDAVLGFAYFRDVYAHSAYVLGALPSLHVGPATWLALNVRDKRGRIAAWGLALAMSFFAVYLTHHYLLDVLAGGLLSLSVYLLLTRTRLGQVPVRLHRLLFDVFFGPDQRPDKWKST